MIQLNPDTRAALLDWFRREARDLPWRAEPRHPYAVWLSEIMLQQTRVETVVPYFLRFMEAFPTVKDLAAATDDRVMALWAGLGYYRRAINMLRCAREVVSAHEGRFPQDAQRLAALPGFGPYTTAAVGSLAFGMHLAVLDGNVERVLSRVALVESDLRSPATRRELRGIAEELLERGKPGAWNEALMELGARVCTPRNPGCERCPLAAECAARRTGRQAELPLRSPRKASPEVPVVLLLLIDGDGRVLVRPPGEEGGMLQGLWELPSEDTRPLKFVADEKVSLDKDGWKSLSLKLNQRVKAFEPAGLRQALGTFHFRHVYTHFKALVRAEAFRVDGAALEPAASDGQAAGSFRWLTADQLGEVGFSRRDMLVFDHFKEFL